MNNPKYVNQTNASNERVSTNGYYTGNHIGTVMQDADTNANNAKYQVEDSTVRMGTMMQDAASNSQPSERFKVTYNINGATGTTPASAYGNDSNDITTSAAPTITTYPSGKTSFSKWNTKADGTGTAVNASTSLTLTAHTTLYAVYA